jgi:hypothetical protein
MIGAAAINDTKMSDRVEISGEDHSEKTATSDPRAVTVSSEHRTFVISPCRPARTPAFPLTPLPPPPLPPQARYDMAKLRKIGALEDQILGHLAEVAGEDPDDFEDNTFAIDEVLELPDVAGIKGYLTKIVQAYSKGDAAVEATFVEKFANEFAGLEDYSDSTSKK